MKKIILLALTTLIMVGCTEKDFDGNIAVNPGSANNPDIIIIDSCEYVNWVYRLAHKGNCRFCKERRQKELKELVEQNKNK
jgi:hypothetical protein